MSFYIEKDIQEHRINTLCELNDSLISIDKENLLILRKADLNNLECLVFIESFGFKKVKQSIPQWIENLNDNKKGISNSDIIVLYKKD